MHTNPFYSLLNSYLFQVLMLITIKAITVAELAKGIREQYIKNPPEGLTSDEVRNMDDENLLDMEYFLHEFDNLDDDDFEEEGFLYLLKSNRLFLMPAFVRAIFIQKFGERRTFL